MMACCLPWNGEPAICTTSFESCPTGDAGAAVAVAPAEVDSGAPANCTLNVEPICCLQECSGPLCASGVTLSCCAGTCTEIDMTTVNPTCMNLVQVPAQCTPSSITPLAPMPAGTEWTVTPYGFSFEGTSLVTTSSEGDGSSSSEEDAAPTTLAETSADASTVIDADTAPGCAVARRRSSGLFGALIGATLALAVAARRRSRHRGGAGLDSAQ